MRYGEDHPKGLFILILDNDRFGKVLELVNM